MHNIAMTLLKLLLPLAAALQELNDDNFEHQTQASTGMTTGSWFVSFGNDLEEALEAAEEELRDAYVIPAVVKDGKELWKRFGIKKPTSLLFAKHRMYRYKGSKTSTELVTFAQKALDGELEGEEIPPERSFFQQLWQRIMGQGEL
eukprot:symbB.v1.2.005580.t1/scaffold326.1/size228935/2